MDPDATLSELRVLVRTMLESNIVRPFADEIAEQFDALDQWISRGGFLPRDWRGQR